MYALVSIAVLLLLSSSSAEAAFCSGAPNPEAAPNTNPLYVPDALTFVKEVENGRLYQVRVDLESQVETMFQCHGMTPA